MNAAKKAILDVHPGAAVEANRVNEYPVTVTITSGTTTVWSGSQKGLFSKNGHRAVPDIKEALRNFKGLE